MVGFGGKKEEIGQWFGLENIKLMKNLPKDFKLPKMSSLSG